MANQINKSLAHQGHETVVASINEHVQRFWDRNIGRAIITHLSEVPPDRAVHEAVEQLREARNN